MDQLERLRSALAGRYALDREIGRGGMAYVYRARDLQHDRDVAIKVLRPDLAAAVGTERFLREIQIEARLQHPHILPIYDSGAAGGFVYYVMPYVAGETLRELIRRDKQLPIPLALRVTREIADALSYAHEHDIVHRDIKPANILLSGEHAVVADFGIAKAISVADPESLTGSGIAIGTPEYMSPEQGAGDGTADRRSDIYALGCVLYEMLAGEPPFTGRSAQNILARHRQEPPPSLRVVRPTVSLSVERAVETALAKVPADRFASVGEFARALAEAGAAPAAPDDARAPRRRAMWWGAAALGLVLLAGALVLGRRLGWHAGVDAPGTSWIVVSDFEGPPDDHTLATAVRELVTAELDQSRVVVPMPRQQLASAMAEAGLSDSARLTPERARELAVRSAVRTVLSGSVFPVGKGRYSIVLRVTDADSGRTLMAETEAATDQDIIQSVEKIARRIRLGLGERDKDIRANKPLTRVATPSFPAYRKFVEGVDLSEKGDLPAGNRLLRDALALDTGFAMAWATIGLNYVSMRDLDSAGMAVAEALRRPGRLTDAQRYWLQGESAYALDYDMDAAIRWYDLYLEVSPRSISAHNNRATYLYSSGRYNEALAEFSLAAALQPFGPSQAQVQVFNQTVTLLALGRLADAETTAAKLTGYFGVYAGELIATAAGRWATAESLAARTVSAPGTPSWLEPPAITMMAGALAARGAVTEADRQLRTAAGASEGQYRRWFAQAVVLLATARGVSPGPMPAWLGADTSSGGLLAGGLWAAAAGDTSTADDRLARLERRPPVDLRRLGLGPRLLRASIESAQGRWREAIRTLGPGVPTELDGGTPDQVSNMAARWVLADAYARAGRPDSAAAMFDLIRDPTRTPYTHLALRGLVDSFARSRSSRLQGRAE